jgi:hypothetical protein
LASGIWFLLSPRKNNNKNLDSYRFAVFRMRIRLHMFLGLPDPDPLVGGMDPDPAPDPSIINAKIVRKTLIPSIL